MVRVVKMRAAHPHRLWAGTVLLLAAAAAALPSDSPRLPVQLDVWGRGEWERAEGTELERLAGGQAALLREYGCLAAERAVYSQAGARWQITLYEIQDRSGAYGAFTLLRERGSPVELGESGVRAGDRFLFYQGNYLVAITGAAGAAHLPLLARHLERQAGMQASLPTLPSYLPADGLLAASDRYLLGPVALAQVVPLAPGDWLGFAYGAEAEAARYRVEGEDGTFLLINYPTPQIAAERLRDFERLFNLNGTGDPSRPLAYAKRAGTLVAFVAGIKSGQAAARILNQVRYEAELSWSRLSEPRAQPSWVLTLMNIFIATGVLMLFVILSGITFGLVRLAIQRLLPGKVFDRPGDTEIIRLNLDDRR